MPNWFWYVAKDDELFVDIDRYKESIQHIRRRLQGAIEHEKLDVDYVHLTKSLTKNHAHMVVVLNELLPPTQKFAWEMLLHGDIYRAACNIMRDSFCIKSPDILITKELLHRKPDAECNCTQKHTRSIMGKCEAAIFLRGSVENATAGFFGKPSNNPCKILPDLSE